jgi:hypothetical protein
MFRVGSYLEATQGPEKQGHIYFGIISAQFGATYLEALLYNAWNYKWATHYILAENTLVKSHSPSLCQGVVIEGSWVLRAAQGTEQEWSLTPS